MGHTNNIPRSRPLLAEPRAPHMPPLGFCVQCVADHKSAMAKLAEVPLGGAREGAAAELPGISEAIMLVGGSGCCFNHLQVQVQSPLLVPR